MFKVEHRSRLHIHCVLFAVGIVNAIMPCQAEVVSLASTLQESADVSYDIKIARTRALELHSDIRAARADYFPTLQAVGSFEYDKGLKNSPQQVFSVANTTFNATTRYQALASFQSTWTLFDFGARGNSLKAAKRLYEAALLSRDTALRDLRISVIEAYMQALSVYKALKAKEQIVPVFRELFDIKRQTYQAGTSSRVELGEQSLQLAQAEDNVRELRETLTERLNDLSQYTHHNYSIDTMEMVEIDNLGYQPAVTFRPHDTPDYLQFENQILAKRAELRALLAQRFPFRASAPSIITTSLLPLK